MNIKITNVTKEVNGSIVLNDVNMELESGAVYGLLGKNGSGKTMLMRAICGLIRPSSGTIETDGKVIGKDLSFPQSIGMILETPVFLPDKTGYENLHLLASIRGEIGPCEVKVALERVGLDAKDPRKVKKYSLGMRQRLGSPAPLWSSRSFCCWTSRSMVWMKAAAGWCRISFWNSAARAV